MQQITILIIGIILSIPTYGISLVIAIWLFNHNGKKIRKSILTNLITDAYMGADGEDLSTDLIFYESAKKFAEENGGRSTINGKGMTFHLTINGDKVSVYFYKGIDGKLEYYVENYEKSMQDTVNSITNSSQNNELGQQASKCFELIKNKFYHKYDALLFIFEDLDILFNAEDEDICSYLEEIGINKEAYYNSIKIYDDETIRNKELISTVDKFLESLNYDIEDEVSFRLLLTDKVMQEYSLGKYAKDTNIIEMWMIEPAKDGNVVLEVYENYIIFNFTNTLENKTYSDIYEKSDKDGMYFNKEFGYLSLLEDKQILENTPRNEERYSNVINILSFIENKDKEPIDTEVYKYENTEFDEADFSIAIHRSMTGNNEWKYVHTNLNGAIEHLKNDGWEYLNNGTYIYPLALNNGKYKQIELGYDENNFPVLRANLINEFDKNNMAI